MRFQVPLKALCSVVLTVVCAGPLTEPAHADPCRVSAARLTVDLGRTINTMRGGLGASMHAIEGPLPVGVDQGDYRSWGGSVWGGVPDPEDEAAWQQVYRHADWLGLDWNRVEIDHRMFEPERGVLSKNNKEMRTLYRWLDYCQSRGADVLLQEMWPDVEWLAYPELRGDRVARLRSAPADLEAWADGLVRLVDYLVRERGYTSILWLSIANEPMQSWSWWRDASGAPQDIVPALAVVKRKLEEKELPVRLAALDWPTPFPPIEKAHAFGPLVGAYSFHDYGTTFDWWDNVFIGWPLPRLSAFLDQVARWKAVARADGDKPLFFSEIGTFMQGFERDARGPGHYLSLLKDVQFVLRTSNVGVDAFNRWSFVNRGDLDGQWQLIETWDRLLKRLRPEIRPKANSYFLYGLLTRFVPKHARVFATRVEGGSDGQLARVFAAAYGSARGNLTIAVTNDSDAEAPLTVELSSLPGRLVLHKYAVTPAAKDRDDVTVAPLASYELQPSGAVLVDSLPAKSLVVYSSYKLAMADKGIVADE
jgi:hypothetical protein